MKKCIPIWNSNRFTVGSKEYGLQWRRETPQDEAFLLRLFVSVRGGEFAASGLPEELQQTILWQQFCLQRKSYGSSYLSEGFGILEQDAVTIGRLYLAHNEQALRIVDLSLLPEWRNCGVGTRVLRHLCAEAARESSKVALSVFASNPARRLYRRLGFLEVGESSGYLQMEWNGATQGITSLQKV
jgi:GNAT superfamily N-acetyltransferase